MKTYNKPRTAAWKKLCTRPSLEATNLDTLLTEIFQRVGAVGDAGLVEFTKQFDGVDLDELVILPEAMELWAQSTGSELRLAIDQACMNITRFHEVQCSDMAKERVETMPGVVCWRESRPIEKVGLYVPGGSALLISTVLMLGVPAQIAGCKEIVLCTPPRKDGSVDPAICYAALKVGITKIFTVGGAQAIAGMAIGTSTIPKVDKIFGPGNQYVTAAKQYAMKYGVAIDMPAGPSELMVVADNSANPAFVAADLLSQAEHGPDSQVVLITTDAEISKAVQAELRVQINNLPRREIAKQALENSFVVIFDKMEQIMDFANRFAPEHLILCVKQPKKWSKQVFNAGSVFLGNYSPESAGDYASGTNHTLPTNGWARSYGGVSLDSFVKKITFQSLSKAGLQRLATTLETLAEAEGLMGHAYAVTVRTSRKKDI